VDGFDQDEAESKRENKPQFRAVFSSQCSAMRLNRLSFADCLLDRLGRYYFLPSLTKRNVPKS
jgi:hypothetical protein